MPLQKKVLYSFLSLTILLLGLEIVARLFLSEPNWPDPLTNWGNPLRNFDPLQDLHYQFDPEANIRIVITGGSLAFGMGATSEQNRFPSQLRTILDERYPTLHINVINAAVPGFQSVDEFTLYTHALRKMEPDVVIMLSGFN